MSARPTERPQLVKNQQLFSGLANNALIGVAINVLRAGHARFAWEVSGAVRPPAAGTRRAWSGVGSLVA